MRLRYIIGLLFLLACGESYKESKILPCLSQINAAICIGAEEFQYLLVVSVSKTAIVLYDLKLSIHLLYAIFKLLI